MTTQPQTRVSDEDMIHSLVMALSEIEGRSRVMAEDELLNEYNRGRILFLNEVAKTALANHFAAVRAKYEPREVAP